MSLPEDGGATEPRRSEALTLWIGAAVTALALAGVAALLADHFLLGALRLAAGVLAGLGLGAALLAVLAVTDGRGRRPPRRRVLLAGALAFAAALALTLPAVLAVRVAPLEHSDAVLASIAPLAEGDVVHGPADPDAPVLVRRASGGAQLLDASGVQEIDAAGEDVVALSADGTYLVHVHGESTDVLSLDAAGSPGATSEGGAAPLTLEGAPLALDGQHLVMRHCEGGTCRLAGYDLTAPEEPLWVIGDAEETRGPDPLGHPLPARAEQSTELLGAARATGALPAVPLRFDPAQGWVQLDPATGFPVGRLLAGAEEDCRIAATAPRPTAQDPLHAQPLVLTACSGEDGALTATAFRDGEELWESAPSPPGTWSVRLEHGRVLATGMEEGTEVEGEIIASEHRPDWTAPGGDGVAQAAPFTTRIGIDGERMVVANESGQLVAYDAATGTNTWTLPLPSGGDGVRGVLGEGTVAVLDPVERTAPLDPRGAQRLRLVEAGSGEVLVDEQITEDVTRLDPVGGGRALVTLEGRTVLLGR